MIRRKFLQNSAVISLGFLGLSRCTSAGSSQTELFRYGALVKDPAGYIDLPPGFQYQIISKSGTTMSDGLLLPGMPDGMAAFSTAAGKTILIRNHELSPKSFRYGAFGDQNEMLGQIDQSMLYDYGKGDIPSLGGTSTVVYDEATGQVELEYLSLAGTNRNCAGGLTPWGSWITCEEDVSKISESAEKNHGYNFEVVVSDQIKMSEPIPITGMGRFNHEAICIDPKTGIVYQTEDRGDSLIYRFLPHKKGVLHKGGKLQVLCILESKSLDTRNWNERTFDIAESKSVYWMDIDDVESPEDDLRHRGFEHGAARFARGEGMWYGDGELYFACTSGGPDELGQVFKYIPSPYEGTSRESDDPGRLILFAESDDRNILKNCDNLTVAPWGDVILCEDHKDAYLRGITPEGQIYTLGHNVGHKSEFAGATFSPSGNTLFVNIQGPGHTLAITGPWGQRQVLS